MVFYRKYRPQRIEDLDNGHVREVLTSVLSKEPPHAFLFTGPKGLGKTSTARIVAKAINCERIEKRKIAYSSKDKKLNAKRYTLDANVEPCNQCDQCISITNGSNLDVMEIDAASNRGIDEIRDLREKIKLSPVSARKKVYIIDEVHMLTTEAFNALLKTLEEPPSHAVFILCTTEMHKVPATIVSRCFHIGFTLATDEELVRAFERIVKGENINVEKKALQMIAKLAEGSFRDGTKILEEVVTLSSGKKITKELVEETYKVTGITNYELRIMDALAKRDIKEGLAVIENIVQQGIDMKYFIGELIDNLHQIMLEQLGIEKKESRIMNYELRIEDVKQLVELLIKAHGEMKYAVLPQLPLELAVIEWNIGNETNETEGRGTTVEDLRREKRNRDIRNVLAAHRKGAEVEQVEEVEKEAHRQTSIEKRTGTHHDFYEELLQEVKLKNHSVAGVLRGTLIKSLVEGELVLETSYKFHKDRLDDPKVKTLIESAAKDITGKNVVVRVELKSK